MLDPYETIERLRCNAPQTEVLLLNDETGLSEFGPKLGPGAGADLAPHGAKNLGQPGPWRR
jgi:hypothetical protein